MTKELVMQNDVVGALTKSFSRFYDVLNAATVRDKSGGRRVLGVAHALAMSEATQSLYEALFAAQEHAIKQHGEVCLDYPPGFRLEDAESPEGPWREVPASDIRILVAKIGGDGIDPVLAAAIDSARNASSFPPDKWNAMQSQSPGANHQRWHEGEVISSETLEILESASRLLALRISTEAPDQCDAIERSPEPAPEEIHLNVLRVLKRRGVALFRTDVVLEIQGRDHESSPFGRDAIHNAIGDLHVWEFVNAPPQTRVKVSLRDKGRTWLEAYERNKKANSGAA